MRLRSETLEALAAAYALGTLQGGARRRLEGLARRHPEVREAVQRWQHQLAGLTELVAPVALPPQLWPRIEAQLRADLAQRPGASPARLAPAPKRPRTGALAMLRPGLAGAVLALAAASAVMVPRWQRQDEQLQGLRSEWVQQRDQLAQARAELAGVVRVGQIAVLQDERSSAALLVSYDGARGRLMLKRVGSYREADEKSLQLWSLAPGQAPKSLGVLGRGLREQFQAAADDLGDERLLAISLEPLGGVPGERGPTGPVLFKGAVLSL